jgi:Nucleotidyl transferase
MNSNERMDADDLRVHIANLITRLARMTGIDAIEACENIKGDLESRAEQAREVAACDARNSRHGGFRPLETRPGVEKPNAATAEKYVAGNYLWNSGNFFFRADVMQGELRNFEPDMAEAAERAVAKAKQDLNFLVLDAEAFAEAPKKSIDFAVMERTGKAAVVPADIGWSDVGNWEAVWQLSKRDGKGNSIRGRGVVMNASNVHVRSDVHLTTVVGVDDAQQGAGR